MKTVLFSTGVILMLMIAGCKKSDVTQATTQSRIQAKWTHASSQAIYYYNGASNTFNFMGQPGEYIDFRGDGKVYFYMGGSYDTTAYGMISDSKIWMDTNADIYDIRVLTGTDLQLYHKEVVSPIEYNETIINLKK